MTETIAILVVFFILLLFGLVFYGQYQKSSLAKQEERFFEGRAVVSSLKTNFMQEIRCEDEPTGTCIDLYKFDILRNKIADPGSDYSRFYSDLFYGMKVSIENLISDYFDGAVLYESPVNWTRKTVVQTPIILRDVTAVAGDSTYIKKDYFGVLNVEVYR